MEDLAKSNQAVLDKLLEKKAYTMNIQNRLFIKIKNHLNALKHISSKKNTIQDWVKAAVIESLEKDIQLDFLNQKQIRFLIEPPLNEKILQRVNAMKQFRRHYSKKQLVLEAIFDKLEEEEIKTKEMLQKLIYQKS